MVLEKKNANISLIRMVAMSFIIICHIFQTYGNELAWWFNVGVQLFLIISGYLYCSKDYNAESPLKILNKQFKKILKPYYFWLPIVIILYSFLCPQYLSITGIIKYILCCGVIRGQGQFWFIPYILFCYLLTPYLYCVKQFVKDYNIKKTLLIYFAVTVLFIILSIAFRSYFGGGYIVCYFIGYFIADIFSRFKEKRTFNLLFAIISGITILCCGIKIYLLYVNPVQFNGLIESIFNMFKLYSHLLLGLAIFLGLLKFPNIKYNKLLSFSDKYSYEIYLVHALFILSPLNFLSITNYIILNIIISIGCVITTAIVFKYLYDSICKVLNIRI